MLDNIIHDMIVIRRNGTEITLKGRRIHGLRRAERQALISAHIAELTAFDERIDVEVVPTTQYLGAGDYAPVVMIRVH